MASTDSRVAGGARSTWPRARGAPPASLRISGLSAQGGAGAQRSLLDLFELEHRAPVWHGEKFCQQIHGRHGRAVFVRRCQGAVQTKTDLPVHARADLGAGGKHHKVRHAY